MLPATGRRGPACGNRIKLGVGGVGRDRPGTPRLGRELRFDQLVEATGLTPAEAERPFGRGAARLARDPSQNNFRYSRIGNAKFSS